MAGCVIKTIILHKKSAFYKHFFLKIKGDVVLLVTGVIFVTNIIDNITIKFVQNVNS